MKIGFAADHAGYALKDHLLGGCRDRGHAVHDFGTHSESSVDYPDMAEKLAKQIQSGFLERGVLVCGSGVGMAIAANRFSGVRAVLANNSTQARLARQHNDANVLCLGSRLTGPVLAEDILEIFLKEEFAGGRHQARVTKLDQY